jgi:hypothetical protein
MKCNKYYSEKGRMEEGKKGRREEWKKGRREEWRATL